MLNVGLMLGQSGPILTQHCVVLDIDGLLISRHTRVGSLSMRKRTSGGLQFAAEAGFGGPGEG